MVIDTFIIIIRVFWLPSTNKQFIWLSLTGGKSNPSACPPRSSALFIAPSSRQRHPFLSFPLMDAVVPPCICLLACLLHFRCCCCCSCFCFCLHTPTTHPSFFVFSFFLHIFHFTKDPSVLATFRWLAGHHISWLVWCFRFVSLSNFACPASQLLLHLLVLSRNFLSLFAMCTNESIVAVTVQ